MLTTAGAVISGTETGGSALDELGLLADDDELASDVLDDEDETDGDTIIGEGSCTTATFCRSLSHSSSVIPHGELDEEDCSGSSGGSGRLSSELSSGTDCVMTGGSNGSSGGVSGGVSGNSSGSSENVSDEEGCSTGSENDAAETVVEDDAEDIDEDEDDDETVVDETAGALCAGEPDGAARTGTSFSFFVETFSAAMTAIAPPAKAAHEIFAAATSFLFMTEPPCMMIYLNFTISRADCQVTACYYAKCLKKALCFRLMITLIFVYI